MQRRHGCIIARHNLDGVIMMKDLWNSESPPVLHAMGTYLAQKNN